MTITPEKLRHWSQMASLTSEGVSCLSAEQLAQIAEHIDNQAARIAELDAERGRLDRESQALSNQLGDCDRRRLAAKYELAELRERKPDVFISGEGAEVIKAIINREMSGAGRYVYFERNALGRADRMGLFIQPVPAAPVAVPAILTDKLIDWVCLTCVDVRNAAGDFEAQDSINEIRSTLESLRVAVPDEVTCVDGPCEVVYGQYNKSWAEGANWMRAEVLRLNSGSKPFVLKLPNIRRCSSSHLKFREANEMLKEAIKDAGGTVSDED